MTEKDLKALLSDMSLKEKIGQLTQLDASCFSEEEGPVTGAETELGFSAEDFPYAGSILGVVGAEQIEKLQKKCMEKQPHHIPVLFMADIINGYRTVFPIPLALGCSFEPKEAKEVGDVMAKESAAAGLHVTFAPMVDLVRDARWGRVMESTGEDPYLNAQMAAAMVQGIQGEAADYDSHLGACTKHFAAYGAPTAGREYNTVELSERTLREDYLPSYQAAIDAGSAMVMTSFNTLDRIPATANQWLMKDVLREEMGFQGVLISDWNAIGELITNGVAEGKKEAARQAIQAGTDMDMMSGCYMSQLENLVQEGTISEDSIDTAVLRVLELKNKMGLFENPYRSAGTDSEEKNILTEENREAARKVAADTMVLLENKDHFLPLKKEEKVAFIGPYAEEKRMLGAWSFFANPEDTVTCREALEEKTENGVFAKGCGILNPGQTVYGFRFNMTNEDSEEDTEKMIQEAAEEAAKCEKAVLFLGESCLQSGEGGSRGDITIPEVQKKLLRAVAQANPNLAVVVLAGRPLDIREIKEHAKAIVYAWFPGTEGGHAIADILYGDRNPQARLAMSLPWCVSQVPVFYGEFPTGRHVEDGEQIENRFLSRYTDMPNQPLYPFGYGLSYTEYSYGEVQADKQEFSAGESVQVWTTVKNTGNREGTETVQLYITDECGSVARPLRELKGFQKVTLKPGEEKKVCFTIEESMLRFYRADMKFAAEPGTFTVRIGADSRTENRVKIYLK
ncbi:MULTISPECIES: beta-glucosidase BglX [Blautia]|uniref:Beta-glucosidase BglX n=1 Tax=Blautia argi TaxID=1912897 RepID=A0A2Z4UDZ3_9FIRM|nr:MULTISPECIES: beta-glucosidase BglX [Blautia]AWY99187.1 beta-glucosidase BglX [Blautia argi]